MSTLLIYHPMLLTIVCTVIFATVRLFAVPSDRKRCEYIMGATLLMWPAFAACDAVTQRLSQLVPEKFDLFIFDLDRLFGIHPSFLIGRIAARHVWLKEMSYGAYNALPCAMLLVFGVYLWLREKETTTVIRTFVLNFLLALPIYLTIPVCGPRYAFPSFPFAAPVHLKPHTITLMAPPNGIPSVHMSTALLILCFAWPWRVGRILGIAYLFLIVIATLASGEHYLFDLVCAVPYTGLVYWLAVEHPLKQGLATERDAGVIWPPTPPT